MKLFGVMSDGVNRPMFEPLFKAPRELLSLGAPQASYQSQGGRPAHCGPLCGVNWAAVVRMWLHRARHASSVQLHAHCGLGCAAEGHLHMC